MVNLPRALSAAGLLACALLVAACSSSGKKPEPKPLPPNPNLLAVQRIWTAQVGEISGPMTLRVTADGSQVLAVGGKTGEVTALSAASGQQLWRTAVGARVTAGVGSDGQLTSVVTENNDLVTLDGGKEIWRQPLGARSYTPPLVAGARVFVLTADRVLALDGQTGRRLWSQPRVGEPLMLRQSGSILAVGNVLVVGVAGRLMGLNPLTGEPQWQAAVAVSRGANDIERLVDLVGSVSRQGSVVCGRAYQSRVGCVDTNRGSLIWAKNAQGYTGLGGDADRVFGTEGDGRVIAWQRASGDQLWSADALRYRNVSAPLALGRAVAVGDGNGNVHLLSREDGSTLTRLITDGSAIEVQPVLAGNTLVVATQKGAIYGFRPE
ncbi:outer membrane protein assembly factor BamB [Comamonas sp. BIGb0124]|uniref:outer membrane protein assembly factor BamB n=1 Tax=Comamonas sp. BIGb0124 TaxID=2485130 RepID=UPI000F4AC0CC|nr:outer membrane protein assembly factor BamB [Comamonas sp. BIGb0124]